ncbi:MAG: Na/Pi cotransporter family protein [Pseudomonadota bacterium]
MDGLRERLLSLTSMTIVGSGGEWQGQIKFSSVSPEGVMNSSDVNGTQIPAEGGNNMQQIINWLIVVGLVYALMVSVGVLSQGFRVISGGADGARSIFEFATNPIVGVLLGVLATALVQSSSAVTSVIVGLVGGGLPVAMAIPMIMGSNMGTTVTNTLAALGNIGQGEAFNRSFSAATVHDFFNFITILIFLPIEMLFHPLEKLAVWLSQYFQGSGDASMNDFDVIRLITRPVINAVRDAVRVLPDDIGGFVLVGLGIVAVLGAVYALNKMLRRVMTGGAQKVFNAAVGKSVALAVLTGLVVTLIVQSSTLTTVLIVPMAGAGMFTLAQVYPFTLGANIGTPITALLAATAVSGEFELFALQIALVHLLYNGFAVVLFALIPPLWRLPMQLAQALANGAERSRMVVFGYIFGVFFLLPGLVFMAQYLYNNKSPEVLEAEKQEVVYDRAAKESEEKGLKIE